MTKLALLGGLSAEQFLQEYWQKKPLLVRQALPDAEGYIDADQLAGLSLEKNVESRIIIGADSNPKKPWQLLHGPFSDKTFRKLPTTEWTLLVQAVNFYLPQFTEILEQFDFIPQWRIDDIMVSYAAPGGSVGTHYDNYDVFLIQGQGKRQWRIGDVCGPDTTLQKHPQLRLLKSFKHTDEWMLETGDLLYLPPRVAHYGVALDDCLTYSVGFQAPSLPNLAEYFCNDILERNLQDFRYSDPDLKPPSHSGLLSAEAIGRIKQLLMDTLNDTPMMEDWVARMLSEAKYDDHQPQASTALSNQQFATLLINGETLYRDEGSRFLFIESANAGLTLYINGAPYAHPQLDALVRQLCDHRVLGTKHLAAFLSSAKAIDWLHELHQLGLLYFADAESEE
ncbi:MAG TPA: cupin domain-containing protein [Pseudomonadales bacterium]|nr:cupin domain-containing protein [Pseudomonadales bacterium]